MCGEFPVQYIDTCSWTCARWTPGGGGGEGKYLSGAYCT